MCDRFKIQVSIQNNLLRSLLYTIVELHPLQSTTHDVRCHFITFILNCQRTNWARHSLRNCTTRHHLSLARFARHESEESSILATLQNVSSGPGAICDEPFILPHPKISSRGLPEDFFRFLRKLFRKRQVSDYNNRPRLVKGSINLLQKLFLLPDIAVWRR